MLGVDKLKAKRAPHVDLGRVLVHVAGIHANESNPCAGQEEKQKKANTPLQACGLLRRTPLSDVRYSHAEDSVAVPHPPARLPRSAGCGGLRFFYPRKSKRPTHVKRIDPKWAPPPAKDAASGGLHLTWCACRCAALRSFTLVRQVDSQSAIPRKGGG